MIELNQIKLFGIVSSHIQNAYRHTEEWMADNSPGPFAHAWQIIRYYGLANDCRHVYFCV